MTVFVSDVLRLPALGGATVLAGERQCARRRVRWSSVIEGPVDDFVMPGEMVLTTGLGCDAEQLRALIEDAADAGAAGVCVSLPRDGPLPAVPPAAVAAADRLGLPLIEVAWEVRFADVSKQLADRLMADQYGDAVDARDRIHLGMVGELLSGRGLDGIVAAVERRLDRPALLLAPDLTPLAHAPHGAGRPAAVAPERLRAAALALTAQQARATRALLASRGVRRLDGVEPLGLAAGCAAVARVRDEAVAYLYVLDGDGGEPPLLEPVLHHACIAVALELIRVRSVLEERGRVGGDLLWRVADGGPAAASALGHELAAFGYRAGEPHEIAVAEGTPVELRRAAARVRTAVEAAGGTAFTAQRRGELLVVVHRDEPPAEAGRLHAALRAVEEADDAARCSWGVAARPCPLEALADGYGRARRALEVARAFHGPGLIGYERELGTLLLLGGLSSEPATVARAEEMVEPLLAYDRETGRDLLRTLETYLDEQGNTSSTARRLHFNRHSLQYRMRKIEQLTGLALSDPDDRFSLELAVKIVRLTGRHAQPREPHPGG